MQNKKAVLIIMNDKFLLELYVTIFRIRGFTPIGVMDEKSVIKKFNEQPIHLVVLEKVLSPRTYKQLFNSIRKSEIPLLVLTKKEELDSIENELTGIKRVYGDILNDDLIDIVRRGERLLRSI